MGKNLNISSIDKNNVMNYNLYKTTDNEIYPYYFFYYLLLLLLLYKKHNKHYTK